MADWFAHSVVIDVDGTPAEVLARISSRLQGSLSWGEEYLVPARKVGAGPPDFVGRVSGRSFRLRTSWRPTFARGHESALEVAGLVEPFGDHSRLRAIIRPRRLQYLTVAPALLVLLVALFRWEFTAQVAIVPGLVALYWLTVVRRDIALAAVGVDELAAAPQAGARPNPTTRTNG